MNKGQFLTILRHFVAVIALCVVMPFAASAQNAGQDGNVVSGTVIDATGYPVIGAAVLVKGTTLGAASACSFCISSAFFPKERRTCSKPPLKEWVFP